MISHTVRDYEHDIPTDKAIRTSEYDLAQIQPSSLYHFRMGRYVIYISVTPKTHEYRLIIKGTPPFPEKKTILFSGKDLYDVVIHFYTHVKMYVDNALSIDQVNIHG